MQLTIKPISVTNDGRRHITIDPGQERTALVWSSGSWR